jgi:hypothetical protein
LQEEQTIIQLHALLGNRPVMAELSCCQIVTATISPEVHFRTLPIPTDPFAATPLVSSLISFCEKMQRLFLSDFCLSEKINKAYASTPIISETENDSDNQLIQGSI